MPTLSRIALALGIATIAVAAAPGASAQSDPRFRLVNETGRTIFQVRVSSSRTNEWGPDLLGNDVLPSGYNIQIRPRSCINDIRIVYSDGGSDHRWQVNTCTLSEVVFGRYRISYR